MHKLTKIKSQNQYNCQKLQFLTVSIRQNLISCKNWVAVKFPNCAASTSYFENFWSIVHFSFRIIIGPKHLNSQSLQKFMRSAPKSNSHWYRASIILELLKAKQKLFKVKIRIICQWEKFIKLKIGVFKFKVQKYFTAETKC